MEIQAERILELGAEVERLREELRVAQFDATVPVRELRERLVELEDALLGYFAGGYPVGTCPDRETAEGRIKNATANADERNRDDPKDDQ